MLLHLEVMQFLQLVAEKGSTTKTEQNKTPHISWICSAGSSKHQPDVGPVYGSSSQTDKNAL